MRGGKGAVGLVLNHAARRYEDLIRHHTPGLHDVEQRVLRGEGVSAGVAMRLQGAHRTARLLVARALSWTVL